MSCDYSLLGPVALITIPPSIARPTRPPMIPPIIFPLLFFVGFVAAVVGAVTGSRVVAIVVSFAVELLAEVAVLATELTLAVVAVVVTSTLVVVTGASVPALAGTGDGDDKLVTLVAAEAELNRTAKTMATIAFKQWQRMTFMDERKLG
jgi:hypothetical protein